MRIAELFKSDVTRDIPPVVYFHEQSAAKLHAEVSEYIVTGGYSPEDPRHARSQDGIHEQFIRLLNAIDQERTKKPNGPELPACWISGFYGSGKSSFAKLLGLALDGRTLPDGSPLAEALLGRDESPNAPALRAAWQRLVADISPMSVVFDIGSSARDLEQIHAVVVREVQRRLGYCPRSELVAEVELSMERDEEYALFLAQAEKTLGAPWEVMKLKELAEDHFSHVLHDMRPDRYATPTEWIDSHAGRRRGRGLSPEEAVQAIDAMMSIRAEGRTLFLVVDEVSQYIHDSQERMLRLQSFVSALGQRLHGSVWLLVTGQQKLEEAGENSVLDKLKDRFPHKLRVHLSAANIRDVVHRRLLAKKPEREVALEALFQKYRADLKVLGFRCEDIGVTDFVEIYPMLPAHIDLVLRITTNLRARSSRMQGDSHAIRGLLQLLGEVFRRRNLADQELGVLMNIEDVYEVLHTALDSDVQSTLAHLLQFCVDTKDPVAAEAGRAVAMLELVQDREGFATKPELVAQCLYRTLGQPNRVDEIGSALERLRAAGLLSLTEKNGYKIQSSAGQEWTKERGEIAVGYERVVEVVREALEELVAEVDRPKLGGRSFAILTLFSDRTAQGQLIGKREQKEATLTLDLQFVSGLEERQSARWIARSTQEALRDRLVWVVGDLGRVEDLARLLYKSRRMAERNKPKRESLSEEKKRLLLEEEALGQEHLTMLRGALSEAFHSGLAYFQGRTLTPRDSGASFPAALSQMATNLLPSVYPYFLDIAVTEVELLKLLEKDLHGPSNKFFEKGLGILSLDAGKITPACEGEVPQRVLAMVQKENGISGERLLKQFLSPPFGYSPDVVRACVAGLLRAGKVRIIPEGLREVTAVADPGVEEVFRRDRDFRRAEFFPHAEQVSARDRAAICKLFETHLGMSLERDNDHIANAVHERFGRERDQVRGLERRFEQLPRRPEPPEVLQRFAKALEDCRRSRHVEPTVLAVKTNLDALRDGFERHRALTFEVTPKAIETLRDADTALGCEFAQLDAIGATSELESGAKRLEERIASERPWLDIGDLPDIVKRVRAGYAEHRKALLGEHERAAEEARRRLRNRELFSTLDADQVHRVLKPISQALFETTETAIAPDLATLSHTFAARLASAEEKANDLLEHELAKRNEQFVKVGLDLRGRELTSEAQVQALLHEIESRVLPAITAGKRVRLT